MSRDDGFRIADVDVGLLDDAKVRRLVRSTRDEGIVARCLVAFEAVLLASWAAGDRVSVDDAAPVWLTGVDDLKRRLVDVGLLDDDGQIPTAAWESWFGAAAQRRADRRFEGTVGGLMKSLAMTREEAVAEARRRGASGGPKDDLAGPRPGLTRSVRSVPSVPTDRSVPAEPTKRKKRPDSLASKGSRRSRAGPARTRKAETVELLKADAEALRELGRSGNGDPKTFESSEAFARHRQASIVGIVNGEIEGVDAERARTYYMISEAELTAARQATA